MNLDEDDLKEFRRSGARVRKPNGESLKQLPEPAPSADAELRKIPASIRELAEALMTLAKRESAPPASVMVEAPKVTVQAPEVTVTPEVTINTPKAWNIEVTARDSDRRIKSMTIKAAE